MGGALLLITMTFYSVNADMLATNEVSINTYDTAQQCENAAVTQSHQLYQDMNSFIWNERGFIPVGIEVQCLTGE